MDDLEILTYGSTGRITLQEAMRARKSEKRAPVTRLTNEDSSNGSDDEGVRARRSARKRKNEASSKLVDSICIDDDDDGDRDDHFIGLSYSSKKSCPSPSSRSPSPLPPPMSYVQPSARDKSFLERLQKANNVLDQLKFSGASFMCPGSSSIIDLDDSTDSPCLTVTLRIRCRGRIHKYPIQKTAPLLQVCDKLAAELGVASKRIMLSHRTETLNLADSPDDIGLTTVDIIDAIIMTESDAAAEYSRRDTSPGDSVDPDQPITIKIQSSKKHIVYSLRKSAKAMRAFAAELGVDVSKVAFSFDGDVIASGQRAEDLDIMDTEIEIPQEWVKQTQTTEVFPVTQGSAEWNRVEQRFRLTLPNNIIWITRIQNTWLWDKYVTHKKRLHMKNDGRVNELELFHGTLANNPKVIYEGEDGFDMRYSASGMWGQANYFAVNASYSHGFAHTSSGYNEMFLVRVLTGDSHQCGSNPALRMPPFKASGSSSGAGVQFSQMRYDTVTGTTGGSQVYMTYDNDKAYPAYLIMYQ